MAPLIKRLESSGNRNKKRFPSTVNRTGHMYHETSILQLGEVHYRNMQLCEPRSNSHNYGQEAAALGAGKHYGFTASHNALTCSVCRCEVGPAMASLNGRTSFMHTLPIHAPSDPSIHPCIHPSKHPSADAELALSSLLRHCIHASPHHV